MKTLLFAAALSFGSAALAQNVLDGSPPERDARGIPVISMPANAPPGANQGVPTGAAQVVVAPNQQQVFATQPATKEYPPCTREITDGCVQAYVGRNMRARRR